MSFWDQVIYDPVSILRGRPWWQIVLWILPWFLLLTVGAVVWFVVPGKATSNYLKLAKNAPLDAAQAGTEEQVEALKKRQAELRRKVQELEVTIAKEGRQFEKTKTEIESADHGELTRKLYGEHHD